MSDANQTIAALRAKLALLYAEGRRRGLLAAAREARVLAASNADAMECQAFARRLEQAAHRDAQRLRGMWLALAETADDPGALARVLRIETALAELADVEPDEECATAVRTEIETELAAAYAAPLN